MAQFQTQQIFQNAETNITHVKLNNIVNSLTVLPTMITSQSTVAPDAGTNILAVTSGGVLGKVALSAVSTFTNAGTTSDGVGLVQPTVGLTTAVLRLQAGASTSLDTSTDPNAVIINFTGVLTGANIAQNTVTGGPTGNIALNTITFDNIAAATITGAKIASQTITGSNLVNGTITATQIASGAISTAQISTGSITNALIATGAVTGSSIAAATITGSNITSGTITNTQLAGGAAVGNIGYTPVNRAGDGSMAAGFTTSSVSNSAAYFQSSCPNPVMYWNYPNVAQRYIVQRNDGNMYVSSTFGGGEGRILQANKDAMGARNFTLQAVGTFPGGYANGDVLFQI